MQIALFSERNYLRRCVMVDILKTSVLKFKKIVFLSFLSLFSMIAMGSPAANATVGGVINNVVTSVQQTPALLAGLSYLFAIVIALWGILKIYDHVIRGQETIWPGLQRFLVAGLLFALPMAMEAAENALTAGSTTGQIGSGAGWNAPAVSAGGLDAMVVAVMEDTFVPMQSLIMGFCYLAGIILTIIGVLRLMKTSQEGPRGPGGFGTIMTFLVAGAMFSMGQMMGSWATSLFGTENVTHHAALAFTTGLGAAELDHVHSVISAVLAFVMVLGWISFVRGFFIIRDVADGNQQASLMAGLTHLFGGALAINLGPLLEAVQTTMGITAWGINFT